MPADKLPPWLEDYQPNLEWVNFRAPSLVRLL